jgi:enoyl-CoA hydratase/carnithine racemase
VDTQSLLFEHDLKVSVLTLNRPAVYNAIRYAELEALERAVASLEAHPPQVVILTATAPGFCSGVDLKESREATSEFARKRATLMHAVLARLRSLPFPTIAAIDGVAAGLGCELAISADLRIASAGSRFSYPEPKVAVPSPASHLITLLGMSRAQDMLLTARWVEADEALRWGLIHRIADQPLGEARELASTLLDLSPISLRTTKEIMDLSIRVGASAAVQKHIDEVATAADTFDRREALTAFAERRQPRFEGR